MAGNEVDIRADVLGLLQNFRGLEPMKELFWRHLNYDRVNKPTTRRGWPGSAADILADDPTLLASGGHGADFSVLYSRLAKDRLSLADERIVTSRLLKDHPYGLFLFSDRAQTHWHFVNAAHGVQANHQRQFRRLTVGPTERMRTAAEVISNLDLSRLERTASQLTGMVIQHHHDAAFDIGPVQKDFFRIFAEVYHKVADDIGAEPGFEAEAGRFAQLLLDRLLFLYFIQKKGWLNQEADYLYSRFKTSWKRAPTGDSFYSEALAPLFTCLSNAETTDREVGVVPFLNGGLFEDSDKQSWADRVGLARLHVKNSTFRVVFENLLERFNFTVTEDTPLDVEVAIDPEMLGKIFESLILELEKDPGKDLRRLTGSYYTPRPIVHFMCQQALREFLNSQSHDADWHAKIAHLLETLPAEQLDEGLTVALSKLFTVAEAKALRQAVIECRICDPAVGSGAFPVGLLHEMVAVIAKLDTIIYGRPRLSDRNYFYDLKKQVIEKCLYGVDVQEQAVRLCELRLWLSLVVDYQIDPGRPFAQAIREVPSLPNLSYRIVRGDSLLERLFGQIVQLDTMSRNPKLKQLVQSLQADKEAYFREGHTSEKRRLEAKILAKQAEVAEVLVAEKERSLPTLNLTLFGESAADRRIREQREEQERVLQALRDRIHRLRTELERRAREKNALKGGDLERSRRMYFQTGDAPSFLWQVDFAEVFAERNGFDIVIGNPPYLFGGNIGIT